MDKYSGPSTKRPNLSKTVRLVRPLLAGAAMVVAGAPNASANTLNKAPKTPTGISRLAQQMLAQGARPGNHANVATLTRILPNGQTAQVSFGSPRSVKGMPDIKKVNYLEVNVSPSNSTGSFLDPIVDITLVKTSNGKWNAFSDTAGTVNTTVHLDETDERRVGRYSQTVTDGGGVETSVIPTLNSTHAAHIVEYALIKQAGQVLQDIGKGQSVTATR